MVTLNQGGAWLIDGNRIIKDGPGAEKELREAAGDLVQSVQAPDGTKTGGRESLRLAAKRGTMAYRILEKHNTSGDMQNLRIRFDKLTSHDITFVGIIQTARASGLEKFPMPYVLTNCHNSLCAVGGTINEDDHMFGLTCAKKYGGVYVPPHQAVIHQFAREQMASAGGMILGSDSHTRYGALGTMAVGEGGPELVKQLLGQTYDISMPEVVCIYLTGEPAKGVGPQDVALAIIGAVFRCGYVNNKIMEFVGPGVEKLSADFRIGIDVMTTETTCLSSIWTTDERIREYYGIHGREEEYRELRPEKAAWYDGLVTVDLSAVRPMIAMPFHPSNTWTIEEVQQNPGDILEDVEKRAKVSFGEGIQLGLKNKVKDGRFYVDQGIIAGCAGGGFENICDAADLLRGRSIGSDAFTLSVYPASTPIYRELAVNGTLADLIECGAVVKTAFCGPCFGAGDTPANQGFSIRHSTRNFPNREGSKVQSGQIASVALMDARSIAATAANQGQLTAATQMDVEYRHPKYHFDRKIYANRVFDSKGIADPDTQIRFGPNIKDWPAMPSLPENLILKVVSEIHDPVTTTDELIPSGETSSYRSNPLGLAEFALSRKDPAYVGRAKEIQKAQKAVEEGEDPLAAVPELKEVWETILSAADSADQPGWNNTGVGSVIFAVKPGDGSAREQAASCQKVLGGWANIANGYATKRYRSNLINWGMLPLIIDDGDLPFKNLDYLYLPGIRSLLERQQAQGRGENCTGGTAEENGSALPDRDKDGFTRIDAFVVRNGVLEPAALKLGPLTEDERQIILDGCLINYNRVG